MIKKTIKTKYLIKLFVFLIFFIISCNNSDMNNRGYYIISRNGLNLREFPKINSKIVCVIPFMQKVYIKQKIRIPVVIKTKKGNWANVKWEGKEGWVFDVYMTKVPDYKDSKLKPFINLNEIKNIKKKRNWLYVDTRNGLKKYNFRTKKWQYSFDESTKYKNNFKHSYYWDKYMNTKSPLTLEYYRLKNGPAMSVDKKKNPEWILYTRLGEGSMTMDQRVIHIKKEKKKTSQFKEAARFLSNKNLAASNEFSLKIDKNYIFPFEEASTMQVEKNLIWIGSSYGLSSIHKKTGKWQRYLTLPAGLQIANYIETKTNIYFTDPNYGLYVYNKISFETSPVKKIQKYCRNKKIKLYDIYHQKNKMYIIGSLYSSNIYEKNRPLILIYDLIKKSIIIKFANVDYLEHFYNLGDKLLAYGNKTTMSDYQANTIGGVVFIHKKYNTLMTITRHPVSQVIKNKNALYFKSVNNYGPLAHFITVKKFIYNPIKNTVSLLNTHSFSYKPKSSQRNEDKDDDKEKLKNNRLYKKHRKSLHKIRLIKNIQIETRFSKLKTYFKIVIIDKGKVKMKDTDN